MPAASRLAPLSPQNQFLAQPNRFRPAPEYNGFGVAIPTYVGKTDDATGSDNAVESSGTVTLTDASVAIATGKTVGLRFPNVQIAQGATIGSSYLQLANLNQSKAENLDVTIYAEAIDNSPLFTSATSNVSGRTKTTANAVWTVTQGLGYFMASVDISAVIQEVVNRSGWTPGNALSLIVVGNSSSSGGFQLLGGPDPSMAPRLTAVVTALSDTETGYNADGRATVYSNDFSTAVNLTPAYLTSDGLLDVPQQDQGVAVSSGLLHVTTDASVTDGNIRKLYYASFTPVVDTEVRSVWNGQGQAQPASGDQEGHAHRVRIVPGGIQALTVMKTVVFGANWAFQINWFDSSDPGNGQITQAGIDSGGNSFTLTHFQGVQLPYNVKSRTIGNVLEFAVWLPSDNEPLYPSEGGDPNFGGSWTIDNKYVYGGTAGLVAGHMGTSDFIDFDNLTIYTGAAEAVGVSGQDDPGAGTDAGEALTATLTGTETGAGNDAGEAVAFSDTDTGTGTDAGEAVAFADTDTGTGTDAGEALTAVLTDTETSSGTDAGEAIAFTGTDTGAGTDAGESLTATLTDTDTGAGSDAGEALALADTDTGAGTDAGESLTATLTDTDTGAGTDAGEAVALADTELGAGTDAGEAIALADTDTGAGADAGEQVIAPGSVTDTETGTFNDAGESIAAALTDTDTVAGTDSGETVAAFVTDTDAAALLDAGEAILLADTETGVFTDAGETLTALVADTDTAVFLDTGEAILLADADTGTWVDAGETVTHGGVTRNVVLQFGAAKPGWTFGSASQKWRFGAARQEWKFDNE